MNQEDTTPYNLDNDEATFPESQSLWVMGMGLALSLVALFASGWTLALWVLILSLLLALCHLAITSEMSPLYMYFLVQQAKQQVMEEPRVYTQDDLAGPSSRDWALASGAFCEVDGKQKEIQFMFASPVSRPVGRFWSKPKSLLWTISGYGSDFAIKEGWISETGKSYWVEQHDFAENGGRVLRLVQGVWNYETQEFVGDYQDSNGTMGSYPTLVKQQLS